MAAISYFDRIMPRRSLGGFYTSSSSSSLTSDDGGACSSTFRRFRQDYLNDTKFNIDQSYSLLSPSSSSSVQSSLLTPIIESSSEPIRSRIGSLTGSSSIRTEMPAPQYQSTIDMMATSLKCDDCQTNDGLFQCCHCNQRLCIRCCNKHYKKVTNELERLHELSDRLVAKIVHTKNDLERQKNETLEQCHKWRLDTINTINKAHTLIVQTIHNEYETLGKEYELFVQKEMAHIHVDQNELIRMKQGNLGSILSSSSSTTDTTNSIDTIRKRIEEFAKHIDETGKFSFQVKLPTFDIDDSLRVESRFGDATRSTSATWQNDNDISSSTVPKELENVQSTETEISLNNNSNDVISNKNDEIEEVSDKIDEQKFNAESRTRTLSPTPSVSSNLETNNSNTTSIPSTRYALSVENDIELQQQQFYSPTFRGDRYDSAYGTAPPSPSNSIPNHHDHYSSTSSLHEQPSKKSASPPPPPPSPSSSSSSSNNGFRSFTNNRRHTHAFHRTSSPIFHENTTTNMNNNGNDDIYRSVQHVQLKREEDGTLEGVAIQIEQSHKNDGMIERRRTCVQACGVRRRTTVLPSRTYSSTSSSSNTERSFNDQPWLYYRTNSTPSFTH